MAVTVDRIRLFVTNMGFIIGEQTAIDDDGYVVLKHPLRLVPGGDGKLGIAAILIKEEWVTLNRIQCLEIDVSAGLLDLYVEYEQKIHGSIILPASGGIVI